MEPEKKITLTQVASWLQLVRYKSNPIAAFFQELDLPWTEFDRDTILRVREWIQWQHVDRLDCTVHPMHGLWLELSQEVPECDPPPLAGDHTHQIIPPYAFQLAFLLFSVVHMCLDPQYPIYAFVDTGVAKPYVWIHLRSQEDICIVKHSFTNYHLHSGNAYRITLQSPDTKEGIYFSYNIAMGVMSRAATAPKNSTLIGFVEGEMERAWVIKSSTMYLGMVIILTRGQEIGQQVCGIYYGEAAGREGLFECPYILYPFRST